MGVEDGDWLVGIDVRPATGELLGISTRGVGYSIEVGWRSHGPWRSD